MKTTAATVPPPLPPALSAKEGRSHLGATSLLLHVPHPGGPPLLGGRQRCQWPCMGGGDKDEAEKAALVGTYRPSSAPARSWS